MTFPRLVFFACGLGLSACGGSPSASNDDAQGGSGGGGVAGGSGGCTNAAVVLRDEVYASLAGVDQTLLSLDLYAPSNHCEPMPIVIWVHGGAWAIGDKGNGMQDKVSLINGQGWLLVSVNYRLSPEVASVDPNRVMYPDHPRDVASAIAWVRSHGAEYGGDVTRIALLGHSSGAHLVALVATDASFLEAEGEGVGSLACVGSFDTEAYDVPRALSSASDQQRMILENAFGTDPAVQREASPIEHVRANDIPPFILATRGEPSRKAMQESFRAALSDAGVEASVIDASGLSHEEVSDRIGATGDEVMTPPLMSFLEACLR